MKRSLLAPFCTGALASAIVVLLQRSGLLLRPEAALARLFFGGGSPNENLGPGNYLFAVGLGFAVAWTMLQIDEFARRGALLLVLVAELVGAAWILALAHIFFQPLPGILSALIAGALAVATEITLAGRRRRALARLFRGRLADDAIACLTESNMPDLAVPQAREVTFVFCEISNQAELIDEMSPADCAQLTSEFIALASELFLAEGGCLHGADGEGVRVVFGFPLAIGNHAAAASKAALVFRDRVALLAAKQPDSLGKIDLCMGISSGPVVASVPGGKQQRDLVISGEPIELGRRLALANKTYGSQILLDPRAFSEAGAEIVARPIDFLRSADAHERLEVYELLALAADASAEEIACRDRFWTGLVYFRERRWNEAFAEFNRARRADVALDEPLQLYLRRLEPVVLHMATEPAPVLDPLAPL